jgi:hypothetical protein
MTIKDRICMWIAWHLPKEVVAWCFSRVVGVATTGKYSNTIVPELTALEALKRWHKQDMEK